MITSTSNSRVKYIVRLQQKARFRYQEGLFVCEGARLVEEIPDRLLCEVYVTQAFIEQESSHRVAAFARKGKYPDSPEEHQDKAVPTGERTIQSRCAAAGIPLELVSGEVMEKLAGTVSPQGILALVRMPEFGEEELFAGEAPLLVILDNVRDPGNLGTILRTAEAAGADGVIATGGTADWYAPKVVRSTMGSIFRMPHIVVRDLPSYADTLHRQGVALYAAVLDEESVVYDKARLTGAAGLVVGNEGAGLSPEAIRVCDHKMFIPMCGRTESLNAGVAAGILLFEAARQRRYADLV